MPEPVANRYEIKKLLGKGAAGKVYLVRDKLQKGEQSALKLLETPGTRHLELMRHEFTILTKIRHPNIARVYDFGFDEKSGLWFYTSEYIEGRNIVDACAELDYADKARLFAQVFRALQHIHSRGIIHYDVKPSNIIGVADRTARLIDFGLATTGTPVSGAMRGTIGYAAPEVVRGELGDPRSDLYSLGVVFYEALAGKRPFEDESVFEVLRAQATLEPEPPRKFDGSVPPELERIVLRLLEREADSRYYTANEVNRALSHTMGITLEEETVETAMAYLLGGGFVGREGELSKFRALIDSLREDFKSPPVWFITGETGIGKSRLLREVGYHAQINGIVFIQTLCAVNESRPFGPFADAAGLVTAIAPDRTLKIHKDAVNLLTGGAVKTKKLNRERAIHEAARFLVETSKLQPIVIAIDNIDEANEDTLSLLEHIARLEWIEQQEKQAPALLMICACNTESVSGKENLKFTERMKESGTLERINLEPFSRETARELLAAMVGREKLPKHFVDSILDAAGGNPLIIEQTALQLFETGLIFYEAGKWRTGAGFTDVQIPTAGDEVIKKRFSLLGENERAIVEALACIGRRADFQMIQSVSVMPGDLCVQAINLLTSQKTISTDDEGKYTFSSGHASQIILGLTPERHRKAIHERIYKYLEKEKGDVLERAFHAHWADIEKDKLIPLLWEAAKRADDLASGSESISFYEILIERLPPHTEDWFKAVGALARHYWAQARLEEAKNRAEEAMHDSLWQYPRPAMSIIAVHNTVQLRLGKPAEAEKLLQTAEKKLAPEALKDLEGGILDEYGHVAYFRGDMEKARKLWLKARAAFESGGDTKKANSIDTYIAHLEYHLAQYDDAIKRATDLLHRKDAEEFHAPMYNLLGSVYQDMGKPSKALGYFRKSLRESEKRGHLIRIGDANANIGGVHRFLGDFDKALDAYTAAKRLSQISGDDTNLASIMTSIGHVHFTLGNTREALSSYEDALRVAKRSSIPPNIIHALAACASVHSSTGNTREALESFNEALRMAEEANEKSFALLIHCEKAGIFSALCGDMPLAESELEKAASLVGSEKGKTLGIVRQQSAKLDLLKNRTDEALASIRKAEKLGMRGSISTDIKLTKAEILLQKGNTAEAGKLAASMINKKMGADEKTRLALIAAKCELELGNASHAGEQAAKALRLSGQTEHLIMNFDAALTAARCALAEDNETLARQYVGEAEKVFDRIAAALPENYDRQNLRASPPYNELDALIEEEGISAPAHPEPAPAKADAALEKEILEVAGVDERVLAREGLALLGMVSRLASAELDVQKILNLALGMVLDLTQAERGFIILVDEGGNLKHLAARNIRDEEITSPEYQTSHTMVREVLKTGASRLVRDTSLDESLRNAKSVVDLQLHSVLAVPIAHRDRAIGIVYLDSTSPAGTFAEADLFLVEAFAERIAPIIDRAIEQAGRDARLRSLEKEVRSRYAYTNIVGRSKPMRELYRVLDSITDTDLTVNIYGETGTGKELVAKALHYNSGRKKGPFISINCAAMTESLLEGELFGHVKGAFTGAISDKAGLIESANEGTLFLDEVGSMPPSMQAKLLRVIEEREVRRIGASIPHSMNIRLVCSTNIPLEQLVENGTFREDLYYRINVVRIELPPLRERTEDLPILVQHFMKEFAEKMNSDEKQIDRDALARLLEYDYPGNVRQLRNIIQQVFVTSGERITAKDIDKILKVEERPPQTQTAAARELSIEEYMKEFVLTNQTRYGETELAGKLGISRKHLWQKRKEWQMPRPKP